MISYQGDRQSIFGNFAVGVKMKAFVSKCIITSDGMNLNTIYQRIVPKYDLEVPYSYFDKCTAYFADADYSVLIDYHWWRVSNQMCCGQDIDWDQLEMKTLARPIIGLCLIITRMTYVHHFCWSQYFPLYLLAVSVKGACEYVCSYCFGCMVLLIYVLFI